MNFIMHRDRTVATTVGHVIEFKKGEPTYVPPHCREQVMTAGAVPEGELELPEQPKNVPVADADREPLILEAIKEIVLRGVREEFTASGAPHARVISTMVGFAVQNKERDAAWIKFQADQGE